MAERLTEGEITERLRDSEWQREGETIVRAQKFEDFLTAIAYVNRVAQAAQAANHHPDILVHGYNRVRLTLCTHSVGGLTELDFSLASQLDGLR